VVKTSPAAKRVLKAVHDAVTYQSGKPHACHGRPEARTAERRFAESVKAQPAKPWPMRTPFLAVAAESAGQGREFSTGETARFETGQAARLDAG